MAIRGLQTVTIEFVGADLTGPGPQSGGFLRALDIRLVESQAEQGRAFTLHEGSRPVYALTAEETGQLLNLLEQMAVTAPWEALVGMDGTDYELILKGGMSSMVFCWWVEVPREWERVGAVFDYVMAVADRCRAAET